MENKTMEINLGLIKENGQLDEAAIVADYRTREVLEEKEIVDKKEHSLKLAKMMEEEGITEEARREIRNELVTFNLPLVTHIINKYGFFNPDKFQNGCVGLLKAAETFKTEKEVPFHNYAAFCIEMEIRAAYKRSNRMFESKASGFLESLDAPSTLGNGDTIDKHETMEDEAGELMFDQLVEEAEVDTIFYQIIIPCLDDYATRSRDIDVAKWKELELQYFIGLTQVQSQRQRLTFTEMAKQLNTTPQNVRGRHNKVMELIREACEDYGFCVGIHGGVYYDDGATWKRPSRRKNK